MSSIFRKDDNYVDKPKRNTFDMSHQNNLTCKFGELVPVLVQPVYPGDSVKIDPSFGLRYMPQVFPVQTRQRVSLKYYYVRNRNLWKDWPDFIGKTKQDLVPPYVEFSASASPFHLLRPSSLADYLGVPIKIKVPNGSRQQFHLGNVDQNQSSAYTYIPNSSILMGRNPNDPFSVYAKSNVDRVVVLPANFPGATDIAFNLSAIYGSTIESVTDSFPMPYFGNSELSLDAYPSISFALFRKAWKVDTPLKLTATGAERMFFIVRDVTGEDYAINMSYIGTGLYEVSLLNSTRTVNYLNPDGSSTEKTITIESVVGVMAASHTGTTLIAVADQDIKVTASSNDGLCWCDIALNELPFCSDANPNGERLISLPFRAVESIYNALIRNAENNPYMIDGVPEYNKYIKNNNGGIERDATNIMSIKHCNWADDRFTTALPSPQQGNAPLVGLTGVNGATVVLGSEDGTRSTVHLQVDADTGNVVMVDGVSSNSPDYLNDAMMSAVEYGITINDLRNVNSFQRWLENNIRRGYKYKDQLMAHYGVNARFDVLDMPEFIGGVSRDVNVSQVTQTVENEFGNLGDYAGQSSIMGEGHSIEHYCDEHGFIIGLMCVYPMPLYQDTLPKYFTQHDAFDYFFPEFGKIGMQPIKNKELAFSQSVMNNEKDGTFGYQRAWYDNLENLDSVHGAFRFDLRNFLIARDFGDMPKLNADFLTVSHDDLNNTFYSDDDEDKIIGQIYHHMSMKRPFPVVGIPALE